MRSPLRPERISCLPAFVRNRRFVPLCATLLLSALFFLSGCTQEETLESLRAAQDAGKYASTVEALRLRLRTDPKDPELNFLYGRALVATQQPDLAMFALREAMRNPEWRERAGLQIARASLVTGDYHEAVVATTEILDEDPENVDALLFRAQARAHWRNDAELALEDAELALELAPDRLAAYEPLILALFALDQPIEAQERLEEAGRRLVATDAPEDRMAWHCNTTALLALDLGELERAEEQFETCLARHPSDAAVVEGAVRFFDGKGDTERSLAIFEKAYAGDSSARGFRTHLASRRGIADRFDEGESMLREAANEASSPSGRVAAWSDLGDFYHSFGLLGPAAEAFGEAAGSVEPPDAQVAFRYADALVLAGEVERAEAQIPKLKIEAHRLLIQARVAQLRDDHAAALEAFIAAGRLWPDNAWARYFAGDSAEKLGYWDQALEEFRYAVRINAGSTDGRTRAGHLLAAQGQLSAAYHVLFLKAGELPLEPKGLELGAYLIARISNASQLQDLLSRHLETDPASYPMGLSRAAQGLVDNGKPAGAYYLITTSPGVDWSSDAAAELLPQVAEVAHASDLGEAARQFFDAIEAADRAPGYRLILARARLDELEGKPAELVLAARRAATEAAEQAPEAWAALARSLGSTEPEAALVAVDRSLGLAPDHVDLRLERAVILRTLGRDQEALKVLQELLADVPLDHDVTVALIELELVLHPGKSTAIDLARRAVRLGRSAEDYRRLAAVYRAAGESEQAASADEAADALRASAAKGGAKPAPPKV